MGNVIDLELWKKRAEQSYQIDTQAAWHNFWREVDVAYLHNELTEAEYIDIRDEFSDGDVPRSIPLRLFGVHSGTEQHMKFVDASTNNDVVDCLRKAQTDINTFTGEDFIMRFGKSGDNIVVSLYYSDWEQDAVICAVQVLPFEMEVTLCSGDVQKFCMRHKISSLLAKDVYESFLCGLEMICRESDITRITLKGDELYADRWAERHGFEEYGYSQDGLGLWSKTLG